MAIHFAGCNLVVKEEDIVVLASTKKRMPHLYTLEVLFVRELELVISWNYGSKTAIFRHEKNRVDAS